MHPDTPPPPHPSPVAPSLSSSLSQSFPGFNSHSGSPRHISVGFLAGVCTAAAIGLPLTLTLARQKAVKTVLKGDCNSHRLSTSARRTTDL